MSQGKIILIVLVCIVAAAALAALFFSPSLQKIDIERGQPSGPAAAVPQVLTKTFPAEDNEKYTIQVEYPELQGVSASGVQEKVNGSVKAGVYNQIAAFRQANGSNLPLGDPELRSSFDGSFDVILLTRSFFSAVISYSDYSAGAAHPNSYNMALNYDLKNGAVMTLDKVLSGLNPSAGYMDRLGKYVREDLIRQFGDSQDSLDAIDLGAKPTLENYANFTLDRDGLSIHFDPYQVAPYAAGSPVVKISYEDLLAEVVKTSGTGAAATSSLEWWLQ